MPVPPICGSRTWISPYVEKDWRERAPFCRRPRVSKFAPELPASAKRVYVDAAGIGCLLLIVLENAMKLTLAGGSEMRLSNGVANAHIEIRDAGSAWIPKTCGMFSVAVKCVLDTSIEAV
jgi:hypothetical protein